MKTLAWLIIISFIAFIFYPIIRDSDKSQLLSAAGYVIYGILVFLSVMYLFITDDD